MLAVAAGRSARDVTELSGRLLVSLGLEKPKVCVQNLVVTVYNDGLRQFVFSGFGLLLPWLAV